MPGLFRRLLPLRLLRVGPNDRGLENGAQFGRRFQLLRSPPDSSDRHRETRERGLNGLDGEKPINQTQNGKHAHAT
jgi:hypothetical protein